MKFGALDEPTINCGAPDRRPLPLMEKNPHGVEVPTPAKPGLRIERAETVVVPMPEVVEVAR